MARVKTFYVCSNCGSSFSSWYGRCPDCHEWETLSRFTQGANAGADAGSRLNSSAKLQLLSDIGKTKIKRLITGYSEIDRVLGGGIPSDAAILIAGEPGVGKSTLLLSIVHKLGLKKGEYTAYCSSEEEAGQVAARAERMGGVLFNVLFSEERCIESLIKGLEKEKKTKDIKVAVFDSIQTMYSNQADAPSGSITQSREVLMRIISFAKQHNIIVFAVGHVTKGGDIAGPKFLEHMVDAVLFLEGDKATKLRIIRSLKNRFGSTNEIGFFELGEKGITEVRNPSQYFLDLSDEAVGKTSVGVREGNRIVFGTIESLAVKSSLAFPKRVAKGIDAKRLELMLAILKKYLKLPIDSYDIYTNVIGGLTIRDPLADLGIAASVFSAVTGKKFPPHSLFIGEVGLLGQIRAGSHVERIGKEGARVGFKTLYIPEKLSKIHQLRTIALG